MGTTAKKKYPKGFWICGCTEIYERLSYYLGRSLILIFVTASVAEGGLGLSNSQGATMQSLLTAFAYLGPLIGGVVAGGNADRWHWLFLRVAGNKPDDGICDDFLCECRSRPV